MKNSKAIATICVLIGLCFAGVASAAYFENLDLNAWSINGVDVSSTAAELNTVGDGDPTINEINVSGKILTNLFATTPALLKGTVIYQSAAVSGIMSNGTKMVYQLLRAQNDAGGSSTGLVDYAAIWVEASDVTGATEDSFINFYVRNAGAWTNVLKVSGTGITAIGDVAGTTIGGITQANLVDKSAVETISGNWTHTGTTKLGVTTAGVFTATSVGGITEANLVDKSATETVSGSWTFQDPLALSVPALQTNTAAITITEVATGDNTVFMNIGHESDVGISADSGTSFTNALRLPVVVNGTNYYMLLVK